MSPEAKLVVGFCSGDGADGNAGQDGSGSTATG